LLRRLDSQGRTVRVCLVSHGLVKHNCRLQPWRYLLDTALALATAAHDVTLVSDGLPGPDSEETLCGLSPVRVARRIGGFGNAGHDLAVTVNGLSPDVVLWHVGLTSFLYPHLVKDISAPVVGIFTSPVYRPGEILHLSPFKLVQGYGLSALHVLGLVVPGTLIRGALQSGRLRYLVVECETTRRRLVQRGVPGDRIVVARPTIDEAWFGARALEEELADIRSDLGLSDRDIVVGYFGPPDPLRGLPVLVEAVGMARQENSRLKMLALSRRRAGEPNRWHKRVDRLDADGWMQVVTGFLPQDRLVRMLHACDLIALPFEVVPSDAPLSVLEAMALGKPVVTTDIACLPELVPDSAGVCVEPGSVDRLAEAILSLAKDQQLRQQLGRQARERAYEWCDTSVSVGSWNALLSECREAT